MEKYGLSLEELEGQSVELLPDRIEMRRGRGRARARLGADVSFGGLADVEVLLDAGLGSGSGGAG